MTLNLRFENDLDGENCWSCRRELLVEVVERFAPSILGTQEGTPRQLEYLKSTLPRYEMNKPYRPSDATCQYPTLFYLKDRFRFKEGAEFWLSKTPRIHRSKDWDSAFPRMLSYALLEDLKTGRNLWASVTHLDNIGTLAREEQAAIIAEWMRKNAAYPRILMGDFNDMPGSEPHRILTAPGIGLYDSWQILKRCEDKQSMTHHDFYGIPKNCRMDWILVSPHFRVLDACIIRDHSKGRYPSDHFPYAAYLDWEEMPF